MVFNAICIWFAVGIELGRDHVKGLLDMENKSTRVVVIYGKGGIGKTTLATAVFSALDLTNHKYGRIDMQQNCSEGDIKLLQQQILRDIFSSNIDLRSLEEGRREMTKRFKEATHPVFVFVDNALKHNDLEKLVPVNELTLLPEGSRILLTTRNLNETINLLQGFERYSYQVDALPKAEAMKLLCEYALGSSEKTFDSTVDIEGLLRICSGIPLVLIMAGSKLREYARSVASCKEAVDHIKEGLLEGGMSARGRTLSNGYRITDEESLNDVLQDDQLSSDVPSLKEMYLKGATIDNLTTTLCRLKSLSSLTLHDCGGFTNIPETIGELTDLERVELPKCDSLVNLPNNFGNLSILKKLILSECLEVINIPDDFGNLCVLIELDLHDCSSLVSLPDSFGNLSALIELNLKNCSSLVSLLDNFGNLSALIELNLKNC
ncbi:hypothetical protein KI387_030563, partial [Taxus chinensis]